ncbi:MAG TPA: hypothetical protein VJX23_11475 [Candidatus Binataceae bacterium]|nr:hypothetical protein [Candidatus Binataceae bacterium]
MPGLDDEIRELAAHRHLPDSHLARWMHLDGPGRAALLEIARALKLRTGQLVTALDLLDEISVREKTNIAALLSRPALRRPLSGPGSTPERARAFLDELRAIRFPRLRETTARLLSAIAALRLPREIAILLPRDLSSDELTIQLKASDARELTRLIDALAERRTELGRIISILAGGDEV